jgi:H+/gluconate symporter-like permease
MKKSHIKKQVLIGFLVGILATIIGFYFYTQVFNNFSMKFVKRLIFEDKQLNLILIYSVIPNLLAFFVFTKRKEDYKAKGVLMATILVALVILISKFVL